MKNNYSLIRMNFNSDSMRLRRDKLRIVLQPSATRHKFRLCTKFRRSALFRTAPTESQPGDKWELCLLDTKIHGLWPCALGPTRTGRPAVRFNHSLLCYNSRPLRITKSQSDDFEMDKANRRCLRMTAPVALYYSFDYCIEFFQVDENLIIYQILS